MSSEFTRACSCCSSIVVVVVVVVVVAEDACTGDLEADVGTEIPQMPAQFQHDAFILSILTVVSSTRLTNRN